MGFWGYGSGDGDITIESSDYAANTSGLAITGFGTAGLLGASYYLLGGGPEILLLSKLFLGLGIYTISNFFWVSVMSVLEESYWQAWFVSRLQMFVFLVFAPMLALYDFLNYVPFWETWLQAEVIIAVSMLATPSVLKVYEVFFEEKKEKESVVLARTIQDRKENLAYIKYTPEYEALRQAELEAGWKRELHG